jgi:hypothetical protein
MKSPGDGVYDESGRIFALVQLTELTTRLDLYSLNSAVLTIAVPRTSQERHIKEHGHRLQLGCCARRHLEAAERRLG